MSEERIDFSAMQWDLEAAREEELVERILAAADQTMTTRSTRARAVVDLTRWLRPVLAGAAILAAVSIATIQRVERDDTPYGGTADALNLPSAVGEWIARDEAPGMSELLVLTSESEE